MVNVKNDMNEVNSNSLHNVVLSCINCKYFESFRDSYFDDEEPSDEGFCRNGNSPRYGNNGANTGYVCDEHN